MANRFEISTELAVDERALAEHCASVEGITRELRPWFRMTFPPGLVHLNEETVVVGEPICRSFILLFGILPVEWDDVTIVEFDPGRRFLERSSMATLRLWEHERLVIPVDGGARITDRLRWEGRYPGAGALFRVLVPRLFRWRHHQLTRIFGQRTDAAFSPP